MVSKWIAYANLMRLNNSSSDLSSISDLGRQMPSALVTAGKERNSLKLGEALLRYLQSLKVYLQCHGLALRQNLTRRVDAFKMLVHVTPP